jgi:hypothetical protein
MEVIWVKSEPEYFCEKDWTLILPICPSGTLTPSPIALGHWFRMLSRRSSSLLPPLGKVQVDLTW